MNLAGRTILVTGGARGIGRELTRQLVERGAQVVAVGRDYGQLAALEAEHRGRVHPWTVDLANPDAVDAFIGEVTDRHPALSVVINNAGVQTLTDFLGADPHSLRPAVRREVAVNLDAVIALSTGLLPHLRRQPSAAIVNVSTGLALAPKQSAPVYCATKAGVRTFTRALRYQCQDAAPNVRVIDAVMALVDTDMTHGRGRGKISASQAAAAVLDGMRRGGDEIYVGRTKLLRTIMRLSPTLGYRVLRNG
ncbi:SDR family NAD(P)-dependent oxidoreductase [Verrucosispora sp. WMMD1129]|uniref:SDR family oxidoreductase n=1 Tax=Verrucosispora sp. WMMD1129 TaxID=3016093 RepID=UPI00249A0E35|nr:SDR family NAD(P)-dependent oxidoreductase [Verrucosispora sp. WMMD1129]WFE47762.1 SDR family NAD(P)-dependent oxidoreductase [Verrucosispora sp. WMMD1129]